MRVVIAIVLVCFMIGGCHSEQSTPAALDPNAPADCSGPSGCGYCSTDAECGAQATWDITH